MQQVSKKYLDKFINADDEFNQHAEGEIITSQNLRFSSTDTGTTSKWESIPSNLEVVNSYLPAGTNISIGSVSSEDKRYIVDFNFNSNGDHAIYLYYKPTATFYKVLLNSQITEGLNFSKYNLVVARVINDIVYFTDGSNPPRKVNISSGIFLNHGSSPLTHKWTYASASKWDIMLIQCPPAYPPSILKQTDGAVAVNLIANESFQFAFQYVYYDGESSVLRLYSASSKINTTSELYNYVQVSLNVREKIPAQVRALRLIVRYGSDGKCFVVKTWDKEVDPTPLNNHNAGTTQLTYNFYNNTTGEAIDSVTSLNPFDSVPLISGALEYSDKRLFLGDNTDGYDTPIATSLALTQNTGSLSSSVVSPILRLNFYDLDAPTMPYVRSAYYVYLDTVSPVGYYYLGISGGNSGAPPTLPSPPSTGDISTLPFHGSTLSAVSSQWISFAPTFSYEQWNHTDYGSNFTVTGLSLSSAPFFKSNSIYQYGIVFYDKALRRCGVVTKDTFNTYIAKRDFAGTSGTVSVGWTLDNTNAVNEIPSWAYHYAIVRTLNLKTRSFIESYTHQMFYASKNTGGVYQYSAQIYSPSSVAIALDTTALIQSGLGYNFSEGDVCTLILDTGATFDLPVIGQDGNYILLKVADAGSLVSKKAIYEIYTPYKRSENEPFYEIGELLPIDNPETGLRVYSTLSGTISGDVFLIKRTYSSTLYNVEASCPNDNYYQRWDTDAGKANLITLLGQVHKPTSLKFSDTYIPGTQNNGLSTFNSLNEEILPVEMGTVEFLTNTAQVGDSSEGTVMLCIGSGGCRCASIYIGITQVTNADGTQYFIKAQGVIGQVNILKGDYGTNNPESVVTHNGEVWWYDIIKGKFLQYSINGIDDISSGENGVFKFSRVAKMLAQKFLSTDRTTIENFGSRPFIFGGLDPHHKEVYWSIPKLGDAPKSYLSDYIYDPFLTPAYLDTDSYTISLAVWSAVTYPYDILDYQAKTLVYKIHKRWMGEFDWKAEGFTILDNTLYSFKSGKLYQHGVSGSVNNFYGTNYRSKLAFAVNDQNTVKEFQTIGLEANIPEWVHIRSEEPDVQSSDLLGSDFETKEGVNYAALLRDRLSPNVSGSVEDKLFKGDLMRAKALLMMIQWAAGTEANFRTISIGYNQSTGHY